MHRAGGSAFPGLLARRTGAVQEPARSEAPAKGREHRCLINPARPGAGAPAGTAAGTQGNRGGGAGNGAGQGGSSSAGQQNGSANGNGGGGNGGGGNGPNAPTPQTTGRRTRPGRTDHRDEEAVIARRTTALRQGRPVKRGVPEAEIQAGQLEMPGAAPAAGAPMRAERTPTLAAGTPTLVAGMPTPAAETQTLAAEMPTRARPATMLAGTATDKA